MFRLNLGTDNAAFADGQATEVARILVKVSRDLHRGKYQGSCIDLNGNKVGFWELEEDEYVSGVRTRPASGVGPDWPKGGKA